MREKFYCWVLAKTINKLVCLEKTYQGRCDRLNTIINVLVDFYCDYSKEAVND